MIPPSLECALALVSQRVVCVEACAATVAVTYNPVLDVIEIWHALRCRCVEDQDGPEARALADYIVAELLRHRAGCLADYGMEPVAHVMAVA